MQWSRVSGDGMSRAAVYGAVRISIAFSKSPSFDTPLDRMTGVITPDEESSCAVYDAIAWSRGKWFTSGLAIFMASGRMSMSSRNERRPNGEQMNLQPRLCVYSRHEAKNSG